MASNRGRNRLLADIQAAGLDSIPRVLQVVKTDVQDEFVFTFAHPRLSRGQIDVHVTSQDAPDYPGDNYFLVTTDEDVPPKISHIFDEAMVATTGMLVTEMIKTLSQQLCAVLGPANEGDDQDNDDATTSCNYDAEMGDSNLSDGEVDDADLMSDDDMSGDVAQQTTSKDKLNAMSQQISQDLKAVRAAGFRVGKLCWSHNVSGQKIVTMSIQVRKLGLSKNTRDAWNLEASDYVVLLMKYNTGWYPSFEDIMATPARAAHLQVQFRLRKCTKYRPALAEAIPVFVSAKDAEKPKYSSQSTQGNSSNTENLPAVGGKLSAFGVGSSIELFLNQEFFSLMKLRKLRHVSWDDASLMHSQLKQFPHGNIDVPIHNPSPVESEDDAAEANLPLILGDDHLSSDGPVSLPLVAMQCTLRYLVKCTDYCMICHEKMANKLDVLKPYVCGKPLCLFQYMSLGLCPSIEQEIIEQQYAVDLLISFYWARLIGFRDEPSPRTKPHEFPIGLHLEVPRVRSPAHSGKTSDIRVNNYGILVDPIDVQISWADQKATLKNSSQVSDPGLTEGQWVLIHTAHRWAKKVDVFHYARIECKTDSVLTLHIASRHSVPLTLATRDDLKERDWSTGVIPGRLVPCDQVLDELKYTTERVFSLILLLSSLPPVGEIRSYLMENQSRTLAKWKRISPGALKLLRWVIASNRSYIVQLDNNPDPDGSSSSVAGGKVDRTSEKLRGVDDLIQFRFAQGSPETEARFREALQEVERPQRTLLAWHGSTISNWHSIINHGLNFDYVRNGRAYGDGVYFARGFEQSIFYSQEKTEETIWPMSILKITQVISLNELINRPEEYKHSVSCYVVDKLHWIQCRYLLVRPKVPIQHLQKTQVLLPEKVAEFVQEPEFAALGPRSKKMFIPKNAILSAQTGENGNDDAFSSEHDEVQSDATYDEDAEDRDMTIAAATKERTKKAQVPDTKKTKTDSSKEEPQTDFRPGTLDFSTLPTFAKPSYATVSAQRVILREINKLEVIQAATPLHELGWYIDFNKIDNMFQLIVEMHSFDASLPLAQDMKATGVTSIVFEVRLLPEFPISPPFIRVVKPRFLPFARGGGGHVTAGGAMCMELLTNSGWSPICGLEAVFLQVRLALTSLDPRPARLDTVGYNTGNYTIHEAVEAYRRAAAVHGWEVPAQLRQVIWR